MNVYSIPGLGADKRLFGKLKLPGHTVHALDWTVMPEGSTLADFAKELSKQIDATQPHALVGVSMGGMVVQELALISKPAHVVIISSWKGPDEMPHVIKALKGSHPEKLLSPQLMRRMLPLARWQMGLDSEEDVALFDAFIASTPIDQLRIQIAAVLGWAGAGQPIPGLVHIHGDKDHLMPIAHIRGAQVVKGGGHFMVFNRADEVAQPVLQALGPVA